MRAFLGLALLVALALGSEAFNVTKVPKQGNKKIFVHVMPWFETKETSGTGSWGIHWTMATRNPDNIVGENGRRDIAAYYYPEIGPYGSGDPSVIDYQIQMMKYAGVDGVFMDWPGSSGAFDYAKNAQNAEALINRLEAAGLQFAMVYEDHNLGLAQEGGYISDIIGQGRADMQYMQNTFFNKANYVKVNGNPLLMTFGPQTLTEPNQWTQVFEPLNPKPTFLTLWYQEQQAAGSASGEYCWIYSDFLEGLRNFYNNRPLQVKIGGAYPGFRTFYTEGGWGGPGWELPVGPDTFRNTLNLAVQSDVEYVQIATWNDYGEGTIIEPTREFGNEYLNILQQTLKVPYGNRELNLIKELYNKRKQFAGKANIQSRLDEVYNALNDLQPDIAEKLLKQIH